MDKNKKPLPTEASSSDESTSDEEISDAEDEDQQGFVRSDRITQKSVPEEEEDQDGEDGDEDEEDSDHLHQRPTSGAHHQANPYEAESESDSDATSASQGKSHQTADESVPKVQNANGHGKTPSFPDKLLKKHSKVEDGIQEEKGTMVVSKRERYEETQEKGSSKRQKKGNHGEPSSKSEPIPDEAVNRDKKKKKNKRKKKSEEPDSPSDLPSQQQFSQKLENVSSPTKVNKGKVTMKAIKDRQPEPVKESPSPAKPKVWTPRDELVFISEILAGVKCGGEIPAKKVDGYWSALAQKLKGKLEKEWSKDQLCDKVKRMRVRYNGMAEKFKDVENPKFRNASDKELFGVWDQIWGNHNAVKEDTGRETDGVTQGTPGVSMSTIPGKKMGSKKVVTIEENKVVHEELEVPKSKQYGKESSRTEESESDDEGDSQETEPKGACKEMEKKSARADGALVARNVIVQDQEKLPTSKKLRTSHAQKLLEDGIEAALSGIQECARQAVEGWQNRALAMVEETMKEAGDQARLGNGMSPFSPFSGVDVMDWSPSTDDEALHKQWHELRIKELDIYHKRLELMQRECQLRQDQLKLQLKLQLNKQKK